MQAVKGGWVRRGLCNFEEAAVTKLLVAVLCTAAGGSAFQLQATAPSFTHRRLPGFSTPVRTANPLVLRAPKTRPSLHMLAGGRETTPLLPGLYCLHVCLQVRADRRDEFLECIKANQRGTLTTEPLAVTYLFGEDETAPNTFRFFEAYKGRAGFEAHTKTPHFADWETFVATDPLSAPPQVQFYSEFPAGAPRLPELTAEHYCLGVCLRVKPERRDEFLESIKANQRGTLTTEPLVVTYLVGEDETAPNTFHLFEAYKGRAGFEAHTKSPHFAVWEKFVATEPFSAPPQVLLYVRVYMRACVCLPACLPTYLPACLSVSLFLSFSLFVCMCMCVFVRARPRMCLGNV